MLSAAAKWAANFLKTLVSNVANATSNKRHVFHMVPSSDRNDHANHSGDEVDIGFFEHELLRGYAVRRRVAGGRARRLINAEARPEKGLSCAHRSRASKS